MEIIAFCLKGIVLDRINYSAFNQYERILGRLTIREALESWNYEAKHQYGWMEWL